MLQSFCSLLSLPELSSRPSLALATVRGPLVTMVVAVEVVVLEAPATAAAAVDDDDVLVVVKSARLEEDEARGGM